MGRDASKLRHGKTVRKSEAWLAPSFLPRRRPCKLGEFAGVSRGVAAPGRCDRGFPGCLPGFMSCRAALKFGEIRRDELSVSPPNRSFPR
jgi:hypothetical protein